MSRTRSMAKLTLCSAVAGLLVLSFPARGHTLIDAKEATFVAQFKMTMTATCTLPTSTLKAICDDGVIELLDTNHPSIACTPGSSESEIECSITCDGNACVDVFVNDGTGKVYFTCAAPTQGDVKATIMFDEEEKGICAARPFLAAHAEKVAWLGLLCQGQDGLETTEFSHTNFECGRENKSQYSSNGEYRCVEDITCDVASSCDLSFPPISVTSTLEGTTLQNCFQPTTILLDDEHVDENSVGVDDVSESSRSLYTASYQASWSLHKQKTTNCEGSNLSSVTITCQSGGIMTQIQTHEKIKCATAGTDALSCVSIDSDVSIDTVAVSYNCAGDSSEQALTSLQYDETERDCDNGAYHLIQMGTLCDDQYSYSDFYWECAQGEITIDQNSRLTCFESIPCADNTDCAGTILAVEMKSSSNVNSCMVITPLSAAPTTLPSNAPTGNPTDTPSVSPTTMPSGKPSMHPSNASSSSPTTNPTVVPTENPSMVPTQSPSHFPSSTPSFSPSHVPSIIPTRNPTLSPSSVPSASPTRSPSRLPSDTPSLVPSVHPTGAPSTSPTKSPSEPPSIELSLFPSPSPSTSPTMTPSSTPSSSPTQIPSDTPSWVPTSAPSFAPTSSPSRVPTKSPSLTPSSLPTQSPTHVPSLAPTTKPSKSPSQPPAKVPTISPTFVPTLGPTVRQPTTAPSSLPTRISGQKTFVPSDYPSINPPKWTESTTNLPTGHALDDDYVPPTGAPTVHWNNNNNNNNSTRVVEGIAAANPDDTPDDPPYNWKLTLVYMSLLVAGILVAVPLARYSIKAAAAQREYHRVGR